MDCPDCGNDRTSVVDTEGSADGTSVRRRRECQRCSFRFTTYERPEWDALQVKKRSGRVEPFDRSKLRAGVERAVEKRGVSEDAVTDLVDAVETELQEGDDRVVPSSRIGELVSERLRDLDTVAYIRFRSVYEAFSEPEEFLRELDAVLDAELDDVEDSGLDDVELEDDERENDERDVADRGDDECDDADRADRADIHRADRADLDRADAASADAPDPPDDQ